MKRFITPYHAFIKITHLKHVNKVFMTTTREHLDSWKSCISKFLQNVTQWFQGWGHDGPSDFGATEVSSCSSRVGAHEGPVSSDCTYASLKEVNREYGNEGNGCVNTWTPNEALWWRVCWNATIFTVQAFRFRNDIWCFCSSMHARTHARAHTHTTHTHTHRYKCALAASAAKEYFCCSE